MQAENTIEKIHPLAWLTELRRSLRFFIGFAKKVWAETQEDNLVDLAAVMSFYFVLSLLPFLLVIAAFVGWLPTSNLWHNFAQWVTDYLPPASRTLVFSTVIDLTHGYQGFFSIGVAGTIWTASSGFVSLMESLTVVDNGKDTRGFWNKRMIAIVATAIAALFLIASFGILAAGRWIGVQLWMHLESGLVIRIVLETMRWVATLVLMLLGLDLINYFLPNVRRKWTWVTPGRLFVALAFVLATVGFNIYITHFSNYPRLYGALAAFIVLMIWIYMANLILLIGAEIDNALDRMNRPISHSARD